jgi:uncharacterized protein YjbI with pentapeptide repeats
MTDSKRPNETTEADPHQPSTEFADAPTVPMAPPLTPFSIWRHDRWLSDEEDGQRLRVVRADATGKRLSTMDLTGAIFLEVILDHADLAFTRLHGAQLSGVHARGAAFPGAMLAKSTIVRCDFTGAAMASANLGDATIDDSSFSAAKLERTAWHRSRVTRTSFAGCLMTDTGIDRATFTDCDFRGADLSVATEGLLGTSMSAQFIGCDLRDTNWRGRELFRVRFIDCKHAGSYGTPELEETVIERPDLSPAGDGSQVSTFREVMRLWGIDPDAPRLALTHRGADRDRGR